MVIAPGELPPLQRSRIEGVGLGLGRACPEHGEPRMLSGRTPIEKPAGGVTLQRHPRPRGTNRASLRLWAARKSLHIEDYRRLSKIIEDYRWFFRKKIRA
jgi:hypothetical protein